jgi:hypothetical protein
LAPAISGTELGVDAGRIEPADVEFVKQLV